jgi:hypothetical protein
VSPMKPSLLMVVLLSYIGGGILVSVFDSSVIAIAFLCCVNPLLCDGDSNHSSTSVP